MVATTYMLILTVSMQATCKHQVIPRKTPPKTPEMPDPQYPQISLPPSHPARW